VAGEQLPGETCCGALAGGRSHRRLNLSEGATVVVASLPSAGYPMAGLVVVVVVEVEVVVGGLVVVVVEVVVVEVEVLVLVVVVVVVVGTAVRG
jgi:hypothetical protein